MKDLLQDTITAILNNKALHVLWTASTFCGPKC